MDTLKDDIGQRLSDIRVALANKPPKEFTRDSRQDGAYYPPQQPNDLSELKPDWRDE